MNLYFETFNEDVHPAIEDPNSLFATVWKCTTDVNQLVDVIGLNHCGLTNALEFTSLSYT